jgi:hypothetical protein
LLDVYIVTVVALVELQATVIYCPVAEMPTRQYDATGIPLVGTAVHVVPKLVEIYTPFVDGSGVILHI